MNTGNNGVSALAISAIQGLLSIFPECHIMIQHNTGRDRELKVEFDNKAVTIEPVFYHASRRYREIKGLKFANLLSLFYPYLPKFIKKNLSLRIPLFAALDRADVVVDISGGDSFTSIYGSKVFQDIVSIKLVTIRMGKPLLLLPQSYGSFNHVQEKKISARIFNSSRLISCRDKNGPEFLEHYVEKKNKGNVVSCPDLAFSLHADSRQNHLIDEFFGKDAQKDKTTVGLNVSGLLYSKIIDFEFQTDYRGMIESIIDWIVNELDARLIMVPHVVGHAKLKPGSNAIETTDTVAINDIIENLDAGLRKRIYAMPEIDDPRIVKGIIGDCDYFIGSRMHACIGAISQSVPTTCLAYSDKFLGVMELAGFENCVADMRVMGADEIMRMIKRSYLEKEMEKQRFAEINSSVRGRIEKYFSDDLMQAVKQ